MVDTTPAQPAEQKERLPLPPRIARFVVLFAVFVCAACGLVYELALVALGSYLLGDTITQASVVLAVMVFAMGVGSLASKQLTHRPAFWFAVVEGLLSIQAGENPRVIEEKLKTFLAPKDRANIGGEGGGGEGGE